MATVISDTFKKGAIVFVGILIIVIATYWFYKNNNSQLPNPSSNGSAPIVHVIERTGTTVKYSVKNPLQKSVYFWPNTCASKTVKLAKEDGTLVPPVSDIICMLAPKPAELKSGQSITGELDISAFKVQLNTGKYKLSFEYGEVQEEYRLMNTKISLSESFVY